MKLSKRESNIMQRQPRHIRVDHLYCPKCAAQTEQGIYIQVTARGENREIADCFTCDNTASVREKRAAGENK